MTVSTTINKISYTSTGLVTVFPFPFLVFELSHMTVYLDGVLTPLGWTIPALDLGNPAGGDVVFDKAPSINVVIVLLRVVPLTQLIDYTAFDPFPAETHEKGLDLGVMRDQQSVEQDSRALRAPVADPPVNEIPTVVDRANRTLGFDGDGQPVAGPLLTGQPTSLDDLTDVTIVSPLAGQVLKYDTTSALWKNAGLPTTTTFVGDFNPVTGVPALENAPGGGVGGPYNAGDVFIASDTGPYDFDLALPDPGGTQINITDNVIWSEVDNAWLVFIAAGGEAVNVSYDNAASGLGSTNVQDAIDEVEARVDVNESDIGTNVTDITAVEDRVTVVEAPIATGSVTMRTLQDRFGDSYNIKDFGAIGDNVADDTAAIQACIDAAGTHAYIFFPKGTYKLTSSLGANAYTRWEGVPDFEGTILNMNGANAIVANSSIDRWHTEWLTFTGATATGIKGTVANNFTSNCSFKNCNFRTELTIGIDANMILCVIEDNTFGFHGNVSGTHQAIRCFGNSTGNHANINRFIGNRVYRSSGVTAAVELEAGFANTFDGNTFEANVCAALWLKGALNVNIRDNWFENNNAASQIIASTSTGNLQGTNTMNVQGNFIDLHPNCLQFIQGGGASPNSLIFDGNGGTRWSGGKRIMFQFALEKDPFTFASCMGNTLIGYDGLPQPTNGAHYL